MIESSKNGHAEARVMQVSRSEMHKRLLEPLTQGYVPTVPTDSLLSPDGLYPLWTFRREIPVMLTHPVVRNTMNYFKSGIAGAEFWGGPTPGADPATDKGLPICQDPKVSAWVVEQCNRFWDRGVPKLQRGYDFGWVGGEPLYVEEQGTLAWNGLKAFSPTDSWLLTKNHAPVGLRVNHIQGQEAIDLWMATKDIPSKALWYAHDAIDGNLYGQSCLYGAWRPWRRAAWKDGGEMVTDGGVYRFAYAGPTVRFPDESSVAPMNTPSTTPDSLGQAIRFNRDIARMMAEQVKAGASVGLPSTRDENGNLLWEFEWPQSTIDVAALVEYLKYLYDQISLGIGVPPELLEASETGSGYSGRQIPMQAFLDSQQKIADAMLTLFVEQCLKPLVRWNFEDIHWTVKVKPLLLTRNRNLQAPPAAPPGGMPGAPAPQGAAMSLESNGDRLAAIMQRTLQRMAA